MKSIPALYCTWRDTGLLVTQYHGRMRTDDVLNNILRYVESPTFDPDHLHLVDLRHPTDIDIDFGRMMRLTSRLEPYYAKRNAGSRTAILAPRDVAFGIGRMYQSLLSDRVPFEIGVFRERGSATAFLGLPDDFTLVLWDVLDREQEPVKAAAQSSP